MLSPSDTAIVFVLALLLFGPDQLPKLARQLGEAMRHVQNTTHTFMQEMERAAEPSDLAEAVDHVHMPASLPEVHSPPEAALPAEDVTQPQVQDGAQEPGLRGR